MLRVGVIGCGNIGNRHIESLLASDLSLDINAFDPSSEARENAAGVAVKVGENTKAINAFESIEALDGQLDVVILATDSLPRFRILKEILQAKRTKHAIVEKFLFQERQHFTQIEDALSDVSSKVWVNQWMSSEAAFSQLLRHFKGCTDIHMQVSGPNWGLCCNAVHFIEMFDVLTGRKELSLAETEFEGDPIPAKREGYFELTGSMKLETSHDTLILGSYGEDFPTNREIQISIKSNEVAAIGEFKPGNLKYQLTKRGITETIDLPVSFQSSMTADLVRNIVEDDRCGLPSYSNSMRHHLAVFDAFHTEFSRFGLAKNGAIPIT